MIYLDHASTTPTDPRVVKAMLPFFGDIYQNPSSIYSGGLEAKAAIDKSRNTIAKFLNCKAEEVIFTSGGTESDNLAIFGIADHFNKGHIITSMIEHPAVLRACEKLERRGFEISYLKPDENGLITADDVKKALKKDTILVSIMYANNEIGTIEPILKIAKAIREYRKQNPKSQVVFHTDACQAAGYLEMDVKKLGVDLLTLNGSKIYGPKGVGMLFVRENTPIVPHIVGGGQEGGLRSGTENTAGIVGLAKAIELTADYSFNKEIKLRDFMIDELLKIEGSKLNGPRNDRLPNNINISFDGVEGESAVLYLDKAGIACSTGSACSSKSLKPSHVLLAIDLPEELAHCSLRFTLGRKNTKIEIQKAVLKIKDTVEKLRKISATYERKKFKK